MKVAIVDDSVEFCNSIKDFLIEYQKSIKEKIDISTYKDGFYLLENVKKHFDIIFLDIGLPFENGIEIARKLRLIDTNVSIIFLTNLSQYALDGYDVDAYAYMLKPINKKILKLKLDKLIKNKKLIRNKYFEVVQKGNVQRIPINDIVYIESAGHQCYYKLKNKSEFSDYNTLKKLEALYLPYGFIRSSSSSLINLSYLDSWNATSITLEGDIVLPLSRKFKASFFALLSSWKGNN